VVTREVKDSVTGEINIPADYGDLGHLLITVTVIGLVLPLVSIILIKHSRFKNA
jgi:hypothetical protein